MEIAKSYVVDDKGKVKSVIVDYEDFKKIEELLLDLGLARAMEDLETEDELDLEEAKKIMGIGNESKV